MTCEQLVQKVFENYKGKTTERKVLQFVNDVEGEMCARTFEDFVYFDEVTPKQLVVPAPYNVLYLDGVLAKLYLYDGETEKYSLYYAKFLEKSSEYIRYLNRTKRMLSKEWSKK